jgi:hypothetical protein
VTVSGVERPRRIREIPFVVFIEGGDRPRREIEER